jgi:RNA polymerase sigma-70 factor (ECF subfamily)
MDASITFRLSPIAVANKVTKSAERVPRPASEPEGFDESLWAQVRSGSRDGLDSRPSTTRIRADAFITLRLPGSLSADRKERTAKAVVPVITSAEPSDEDLLIRICQHDSDALALLFRRYARIVRGVAYRVLRDPFEADDLLQDIFLLIHRLCLTFDSSKGSARSWILLMTYRRALCRRRYLTTRHFYDRLDLEDLTEALPDPRRRADRLDGTLDGTFGAERVKQAWHVLSEDQRQTLLLYFVEGHTLNEIAHKTGQSLGNVRHHYCRGLEKLRKQLLSRNFDMKRAV